MPNATGEGPPKRVGVDAIPSPDEAENGTLGVGTIKHAKYGFNRPAARSARMMGFCGQAATLGFNLNKLVRELAKKEKVQLVG